MYHWLQVGAQDHELKCDSLDTFFSLCLKLKDLLFLD